MVEPTDTSLRAIRLARIVDRLEPGTYTISIVKPTVKDEAWKIELAQPVVLKKQELTKEYTPKVENGS